MDNIMKEKGRGIMHYSKFGFVGLLLFFLPSVCMDNNQNIAKWDDETPYNGTFNIQTLPDFMQLMQWKELKGPISLVEQEQDILLPFRAGDLDKKITKDGISAYAKLYRAREVENPDDAKLTEKELDALYTMGSVIKKFPIAQGNNKQFSCNMIIDRKEAYKQAVKRLYLPTKFLYGFFGGSLVSIAGLSYVAHSNNVSQSILISPYMVKTIGTIGLLVGVANVIRTCISGNGMEIITGMKEKPYMHKVFTWQNVILGNKTCDKQQYMLTLSDRFIA